MHHLSISQIKLFDMDPLEWVMQYLEGIKLPPTDALMFGSAFAHSIEHVLTGKPYPEKDNYGRIVYKDSQALQLAHDWVRANQELVDSHDWEVEKTFRIELDTRLPPFIGAIDLYSPNGIPFIYDFKTCMHNMTSNHGKGQFWGLKSLDLKSDWQLALYSYAMTQNFIGANLGHLQIVKIKRFGVITDYYFRNCFAYNDQDTIRIILDEILKIAFEMVECERAYKEYGLEYVREKYLPQKQESLYFKKCEFWEWSQGRETVEQVRERLKNEP